MPAAPEHNTELTRSTLDEPLAKTTTVFTFGVQYAYTPHPTLGTVVHPDGYLEVRGLNMETARQVVAALTGGAYAFAYDAEEFRASGSERHYPRGAILAIDFSGFPSSLIPEGIGS